MLLIQRNKVLLFSDEVLLINTQIMRDVTISGLEVSDPYLVSFNSSFSSLHEDYKGKELVTRWNLRLALAMPLIGDWLIGEAKF